MPVRRGAGNAAARSARKRSTDSCVRLQTRTSSHAKTASHVASVPSATLPVPTIASTFESFRASHFAETAADAPVRISVWYEPSQIASGKPVSGCV